MSGDSEPRLEGAQGRKERRLHSRACHQWRAIPTWTNSLAISPKPYPSPGRVGPLGEAVIHLGAVDQHRAFGSVAPDLVNTVISYLDDGNGLAAERLTREPGWSSTPPGPILVEGGGTARRSRVEMRARASAIKSGVIAMDDPRARRRAVGGRPQSEINAGARRLPERTPRARPERARPGYGPRRPHPSKGAASRFARHMSATAQIRPKRSGRSTAADFRSCLAAVVVSERLALASSCASERASTRRPGLLW